MARATGQPASGDPPTGGPDAWPDGWAQPSGQASGPPVGGSPDAGCPVALATVKVYNRIGYQAPAGVPTGAG